MPISIEAAAYPAPSGSPASEARSAVAVWKATPAQVGMVWSNRVTMASAIRQPVAGPAARHGLGGDRAERLVPALEPLRRLGKLRELGRGECGVAAAQRSRGGGAGTAGYRR